MKNLFDYIFFRWYKIYSGMERHPITSASVMVSFYQTLFVIFLAAISKVLFHIKLPSPKYLLVVMLVMLVANYFQYERNFDIDELRSRWKNESQVDSNRRLVLLIVYLVTTIIFPIIVGLSTK